MKKLQIVFLSLFISLVSITSVIAQDAEPKKKIGLDFGLSYWTDYYYRGQSFYNANTGVFFPWVGYGGLDNFYFYIGGEVAAETLGDVDAEETSAIGKGWGGGWYGIDFIVSYSNTVANGLINLGGRVGYFTYPPGYAGNPDDLSFRDFFTARFKIGFNVLLNPTLQYDHNFWLDYDLDAENRAKDGYLTLSIGHSFTLTKESSLSLGLKGGFWYDGRSGDDKFGFSDLLATVKFSVAAPTGLSFNASMNFGYSPDYSYSEVNGSNDFQYPADDTFKWFATFGVSYSI